MGRKVRKAVKFISILWIMVVAVHILHAVTLDRIMQYKEVPFHSPSWPAALDGYRIAFITDTHGISDNRLRRVVDQLNSRSIDMLLLGGDFWAHYLRSLAVLAYAETVDGIFGVEGDHDCHVRLFAEMERHGMVPLSNSGQRIREGFWLAGVEDLWNRHPCIDTATEGAGDDFVILLSHNPDIAMKQDTTGVDLIVSGHTHGGQITLFGWSPYFALSSTITGYGHRFISGWAESRDGVPVFVSNGTGQVLLRVFARPQVIIFTMYSREVD